MILGDVPPSSGWKSSVPAESRSKVRSCNAGHLPSLRRLEDFLADSGPEVPRSAFPFFDQVPPSPIALPLRSPPLESRHILAEPLASLMPLPPGSGSQWPSRSDGQDRRHRRTLRTLPRRCRTPVRPVDPYAAMEPSRHEISVTATCRCSATTRMPSRHCWIRPAIPKMGPGRTAAKREGCRRLRNHLCDAETEVMLNGC